MEAALVSLKYSFLLFFGIRLSFSFAAIEKSRKRRIAAAIMFLFMLCAQISCSRLFGFEAATKIYPLLVHFPILIFLVVLFHCKWVIAFSSVVSACLCCLIPRWLGVLASAVFQSETANHIMYLLCIFPTLFFLERYIVPPAVQIMRLGKIQTLLFCSVPALYYLFEYVTTIYTDLLINGSALALHFIPFITTLLYFVFVVIYNATQESRNHAERNSLLLHQQVESAKTRIDQLYAAQEQAAVYRHDLRHHFSLIYSFLSDGKVDEALHYLQQAQDDITAITPARYCANPTVDLILSSFAATANAQSVSFSVMADLPAQFPLPETELCAILSNALENAVHAAACVEDTAQRKVSLHCSNVNERLLICVENTCAAKVKLENGFPVSGRPGHGYGTKSIAAIVEKHGGLYACEAADSTFILRVFLPLKS